MDKIIGLFVTIFVGVPLTIVTMIISWWFNERMDTGQFDNDSDVRIYVPGRCRRRRSDNRHDMGHERKGGAKG